MADSEDATLVKSDDIILQGDIALWEIRLEGTISGTYAGIFKFKCYLTPLQQIAAGKEQRALLGELAALAPEHQSFLAYALTQLKYRIVSAPPFWNSVSPSSSYGGDLPDEDILEKVLDAAIRSELKYKEQIQIRKEKALKQTEELIDVIDKSKEKEIKDLDKDLNKVKNDKI